MVQKYIKECKSTLSHNKTGKSGTTVIIAQRISSIRHADRILVLEDGHVTGDGTHESLMESCPLYREIAESQMGGAILD